MKPAELKKEYVRLRAEGKSYSLICEQLHISKSTCTNWEKALAAEIDEYRHTHDDDKTPEFNSESFGGYSYTRATNSDGLPLTWRDVFRKRLNPWRKLP